MSKWNVIIKEKYARYKQHGIREVFKKEDGAIDLASVMVGVIVIGVIGGIIATTIFAVIPWAQDNAAKQQLDSIVQAENAYFGLSAATPSPLPVGTPANSFGKSADLKTANLLTDHPRYCATTPDDKKSYTGYAQSNSGTIFTVSDKKTKPETFIPTTIAPLPADCQFISEGVPNAPTPITPPYVDPTPKKLIMTYQCDTTTAIQTPITGESGTFTWNDGTSSATTTSNASKTLTAGTKYTFIFEGTFSTLRSDIGSAAAGAKCIRSVDHWGTAMNTRYATWAFKGAINLTDVPANIPTALIDTRGMFEGATSFNDGDVRNWNLSNVTNMSGMFSGAASFNQDLSGWNTENVTDMSNMFNGASSMNGSLNNWNTSKVANMDHMFFGAVSFNQPLDKWNTSNVTNMLLMFYSAPYSQDLTSWDMTKVTRMAFMLNDPDSDLLPQTTPPYMFRLTYQCDATTSLQTPVMGDSGTFTWSDGTTNTSSVPKTLTAGTKYTFIFEGTFSTLRGDSGSAAAGAKCIRSVDSWGTAMNTRYASWGFKGATNLTSVPANVPSTLIESRGMFEGATSFNDGDVRSWNLSNVANMSSMFAGATSFNQDLSAWNTGLVTDMSNMFAGATAMNGGLNGWNTVKVTNMDHMFFGAASFNQPLNNWNTSNVTNMLLMFYGAPYSQDLTSWDMAKVTKMGFMLNNPDSNLLPQTTHPYMFRLTYQCDTTTAIQTPITGESGTFTWSDGISSTSNISKTLTAGIKYTFIFEGTFSTLRSDIGSALAGAKCIRSVDHWGSVTNTRYAYWAFKGATNLTNVPANIPSTLIDTRGMFEGATSFNDGDVRNWNLSNVTNTSGMFSGAAAFNQDLSGWNTGNVTDMSNMFFGASSMNGSLNNWNTSKVANMDRMFFGAASFNQPLNNWNTSNVTNMLLMFYGSPYSQDLTSWDMNKVTKMGFMLNNPDSNLLPRTTHPYMFRLTYQCDATTVIQTPIIGDSGTFTWSDATTNTSSVTKTLTAGTKYTFIFEGTFSTLRSDSGSAATGAKCIRSVDSWGSATNTRYAYWAFKGATNLTNVPADIPTILIDTRGMFEGATSFNDGDVRNWNVSSVVNMGSMFAGATSFNQDLSGWNTAVVTNGTLFAPASFPNNYLPPKTSK